jgi:hypothetical protein
MRFRVTRRLIKNLAWSAIVFTVDGFIERGVFHESYKVALAPFLFMIGFAIINEWRQQRTTKQSPPNADEQDAPGGQDHRAA